MKIIDKPLLALFRSAQRCEWCKLPTPEGCHPHHLTTRGFGGGTRLDVRINLMSLCWRCHNDYHSGQILRDDLLAIVAQREKTTQDAIREEIWRLRRL